jgi:peroxiredoxin Q/BCP
MSTLPEPGSQAPHFEGTTQDGSSISLDDFAGKKLALYFYPKDNTPGCTKQACNLRDNYSALLDAGIQIVGVSGDSVESHQKFASKHELPFPLIADKDKEIMETYGVWGEKKMYGRTFLGTKRTTFLIDEDGIVQHVIKKPKTSDHTAEVLKGFTG